MRWDKMGRGEREREKRKEEKREKAREHERGRGHGAKKKTTGGRTITKILTVIAIFWRSYCWEITKDR